MAGAMSREHDADVLRGTCLSCILPECRPTSTRCPVFAISKKEVTNPTFLRRYAHVIGDAQTLWEVKRATGADAAFAQRVAKYREAILMSTLKRSDTVRRYIDEQEELQEAYSGAEAAIL